MEIWAVEYLLSNAAPEYVFEWLKNNTQKEENILFDNGRYELEQALLSRNNKLINLGLALYGGLPSTGLTLFKSDDLILKRAALAGRSVHSILGESWILKGDIIPALLEDEKRPKKTDVFGGVAETTLLYELLNNKFISAELLESLYKKSDPFSGLNDDLWVNLVAMSARNERLSIPYEGRMDGFSESRYNAVFSAAWCLFRKFPVNTRTANVLEFLSNNLVPYGPHDMNIVDIMDRWRSDDDEEDKVYSRARSALVKIIAQSSAELDDLKNSEDLAIRQGYYANIHHVKPDDIAKGFEKDGIAFLDSALYNDAFYVDEENRYALSRACWDAPDKYHHLDYPNYFNGRCKYLSAKKPEWFKDSWSNELPFQEIEDPGERREKRLMYLNSQVAELHKAFLGDKESNELDNNNLLNDLRLELQQLSEHLRHLYQKTSSSWGYLAVGGMLGFILARY